MSCLSDSYTDVFKDLCDRLVTVWTLDIALISILRQVFIIFLLSFHFIQVYILGLSLVWGVFSGYSISIIVFDILESVEMSNIIRSS